MLSRFSVKRPYTVIVGVVLALILGFVSLQSMTTDLLPSMNLPYAVVYTTYIGASPEEVENTVTRPVESSMATVSNIKNIQSISAENISMVILEFEQTANMDSISIEMRETLDQIAVSWDDNVGNPMIMKLNPDMMPIMIAAVDMEGLSGAELTDYIDNNILSELESIEGVASVTATGEIEESLQIILTQAKIDAANAKVREALNEKFADARQELADARDELEDGINSIEEGERQLADAQDQIKAGQQELANQIAAAKAETDTKKVELLETKLNLTNQLAELTSQLSTLRSAKTQLKELQTQYNQLRKTQSTLETTRSELAQLGTRYAEALLAVQAFQLQIEAINNNSALTDAEKAGQIAAIEGSDAYKAAQDGLALVQQQMQIIGITPDQLASQIADTELAYQQVTLALEAFDAAVTGLGYDPAKLGEYIAELDVAEQQLESGIAQINEILIQLEAGQIAITDAQVQINVGESTGNLQLYSALAETIAGKQGLAGTKAQLESGLNQLEASEEQIDDSVEDAYEQADLTNLITRTMVTQILQAQNFTMPAGYITEDNAQILVRVGDKFDTAEEMKDLILLDMGLDGMEPIRLKDLADVVFVDNSSEVYASINGNPGLMLSMEKQTGYSTGDVTERIQERFAALSEANEGLSFTTLMNQGVYIDFIVGSVVDNMLFGAVLAVIVLIFFLKSFRPTLVIAFSIPISLIVAIVLMYFSNITLNIISLSGLALGVGMLVDNSIVVIENIYRLRGEGMPVRKAAVEGAKQVTGAIVASTLTTVCVFLPIAFTEGITRQLFVDMALTIAYSLLASLVVALTVVPMMSAGVLKNDKPKENKFFDRVQNGYSRSIVWVLKHKVPVLGITILLLAGSVYGALQNGTAFIPQMESTQITVTLEMEEGSTLDETREISEQAIDKIMTLEDVETVGAMAGSGQMMGMSMGSSDTETVTMYLILNESPKLTNKDLKDKVLELTADLPCEISVDTSTMDLSALGGSGISIEVKGKELDTLQTMAADVAAMLESVEGTIEISDGMEETTTELRLIVNKEKASEYNLTVAQVFAFVSGKLSESQTSTTLVTASKDYPALVLDGEAQEFVRSDIKTLTMTATDQEGKTVDVPLAEIVDFEDAQGLTSIRRNNQERTITVSAAIDDDHNIGLVGAEVQKLLDGYQVPAGYSLKLAGENETINDAMGEMVKMLLLAVAFVYLVMVAQFQSLLSPFIIMFTLPLALTGGFLALMLTGKEVSIIAMIGFIMLTGIIVNNGIVLVDFVNQLRREGMEKKAALAEAGKTRLRPILMTALTTILGLLTMAMGMGMGADMVQPMAIVTIGGLLYGTLMTLWVVPCIYDIFQREKDMREAEI